jgi:hypothetical protein
LTGAGQIDLRPVLTGERRDIMVVVHFTPRRLQRLSRCPTKRSRAVVRAVALVVLAICLAAPSAAAALNTLRTSSGPATVAIQRQLDTGAQLQALPASMSSQLPKAVGDWFGGKDPFAKGAGKPSDTRAYVTGDKSSRKAVVLFGDSNASMWIPALDVLAREKGFKLISYIRFACRYSDGFGYFPDGKTPDPICGQWRKAIIAKINKMSPPPVAVVLAQYQPILDAYSPATSPGSPSVRGVTTTLRDLHVGRAPKIILAGYPMPTQSVPLCVSAHSGDLPACDLARPTTTEPSSSATGPREGDWYKADEAAALAGGGQAAWLEDAFCTASVCPPVAAGRFIESYVEHVSTHWATHAANAFGELLACSASEDHAPTPDEHWLVSTLGIAGPQAATFCGKVVHP